MELIEKFRLFITFIMFPNFIAFRDWWGNVQRFCFAELIKYQRKGVDSERTFFLFQWNNELRKQHKMSLLTGQMMLSTVIKNEKIPRTSESHYEEFRIYCFMAHTKCQVSFNLSEKNFIENYFMEFFFRISFSPVNSRLACYPRKCTTKSFELPVVTVYDFIFLLLLTTLNGTKCFYVF